MKSVKQMIIDKELSFGDAFMNYYNNITEEDIDFMIKEDPWTAATFFSHHPFLTQEHVDYVVETDLSAAVLQLNKHPLLKQEHVDLAVEICPNLAAQFLSHRLSEENIDYIAKNYPECLKDIFR